MVSRRQFQTARFRGKPFPIVKRSHGSKVLTLTTSKELMMATPDVHHRQLIPGRSCS